MTRLIALMSLLLFANALAAQDSAKKAFADADKEPAWFEHFDGVTLKEWEAAGGVQIKDGLLILGGPGMNTLRQKAPLGSKFKILIECRADGPQSIGWLAETRGMFSRGASSGSLNITPGEWTELLLVGRVGANGGVTITEQLRRVGADQEPGGLMGHLSVPGMPTLVLDVPAGGSLTIRRIRVDVAPPQASSSGMFIALGVLASIIILVIVLGWYLRRRTKSST